MTENRPLHPKVELDEQGLRIDGEFHPLIAGEFQYWRNTSLFWPRILEVVHDSGLRLVASFVCWDFHEISPGDFDFVGRTHPSRDLARFIDLCGEQGLKLLIRVGPIMDAEWPTRGPAPDVARLERLHPTYLERTRQYIDALAPVIVPRLHTRGGPIVLLSVDNEAYFPYSTTTVSDPTAGSMEIPYDGELVMSKYRDWLRRRYGDAAGLSKAWSEEKRSFDEVTEPDYRRAGLPETLASFDFITDALHEAIAALSAMCRENGMDVPIYSNMKQFTFYVDWRSVEATVASHGLNLHMSHLWPGEQKLVASWYCRLLRSLVRFPWAPEFQGGTSVKPPGLDVLFGLFGTEHHRFTSLMSMTLGLRGISYFMFVERDDSHWAPVTGIGKVRPNMAGFKDAIRVLGELRPDRHVANVGLLWSIDHHRCHIASLFDHWRNLYDVWIHMDRPKELGPWWEVFRRLHEHDIDFHIAPMDQPLDRYRVLIYAGPEFARREDLIRLKSWVDDGRTLLLSTSVPARGVDGADLNALGQEIRAAPTTVPCSWGSVETALERGGVESAIRAGSPGVWSFAYRDDEGFAFFVANTGTSPAGAEVRLGERVCAEVRGRTGKDILADPEWTIEDASLWDDPPTLEPNEIHCVRVLMNP